MDFTNSFDDNENDYEDVGARQDNHDKMIRKYNRENFGCLGSKHVKTVLLEECAAIKTELLEECADINPDLFRRILKIRNKVSQFSAFKDAADGPVPSLEFADIKTKQVLISKNPDVMIETIPLGDYNPKNSHIRLDPEKIDETAGKMPGCSKEDLAVIVFLHELMHHVMRVENGPDSNGHLYWSFREEAMANALMLKVLELCGDGELKAKAEVFIESLQKDVADLGYCYCRHIQNPEDRIESWKKEKSKHVKPEADMDADLAEARAKLEADGYPLRYNKR